MPTRLMVWNIQKFSINKIDNNKGRNRNEVTANRALSQANLQHILGNISASDIFGLIELQSTKGVLGTLVGGNGAAATLLLLNELRRHHHPDWCVVPPPKLVGLNEAGDNSNYTESVAVFYRSDKLEFIGPYVWPKDGQKDGHRAVPHNDDLELGAYPDLWDDALPPIGDDTPNYFAGQYQFFRDDFPTEESTFIDANRRRPFLTDFRELDGAGRTLQIVWVHPSPNQDRAAAVSRLGWIEEIKRTQEPKVVVIAGDFNIDLLDPKRRFHEAYTMLEWDGFRRRFRPSTENLARTRIVPIESATMTGYLLMESIDNIFTRYDNGLLPPDKPDPLVIDRVAGSDRYPSDMIMQLEDYANWTASEELRLEVFRNTINYGHIGPSWGTSDHLALVIDI